MARVSSIFVKYDAMAQTHDHAMPCSLPVGLTLRSRRETPIAREECMLVSPRGVAVNGVIDTLSW